MDYIYKEVNEVDIIKKKGIELFLKKVGNFKQNQIQIRKFRKKWSTLVLSTFLMTHKFSHLAIKLYFSLLSMRAYKASFKNHTL